MLRLLYGLIIGSIANFFIDNDYKEIKNIDDFFYKYRIFHIFGIFSITSGWILSIIIYNYCGYIPSVVIRTLYGILTTYLVIKYVKTK